MRNCARPSRRIKFKTSNVRFRSPVNAGDFAGRVIRMPAAVEQEPVRWAFSQNGDQQVNGDGAPGLRAHGILARAVNGFDAPMLFEPFEEQFDLPAAMIQLRNGRADAVKLLVRKTSALPDRLVLEKTKGRTGTRMSYECEQLFLVRD